MLPKSRKVTYVNLKCLYIHRTTTNALISSLLAVVYLSTLRNYIIARLEHRT